MFGFLLNFLQKRLNLSVTYEERNQFCENKKIGQIFAKIFFRQDIRENRIFCQNYAKLHIFAKMEMEFLLKAHMHSYASTLTSPALRLPSADLHTEKCSDNSEVFLGVYCISLVRRRGEYSLKALTMDGFLLSSEYKLTQVSIV
jgi:hypothetical protein